MHIPEILKIFKKSLECGINFRHETVAPAELPLAIIFKSYCFIFVK